MEATNLVNNITDKSLVKNFGIVEAFFMDGEFYLTSLYTLPDGVIASLEQELSKYSN